MVVTHPWKQHVATVVIHPWKQHVAMVAIPHLKLSGVIAKSD
jgi:hypothetical protein